MTIDEHPENYGDAFNVYPDDTAEPRAEWWDGWKRGYKDAEKDANHDELGVLWEMFKSFHHG